MKRAALDGRSMERARDPLWGHLERAIYRGHDGLRRYLGTMEEEFKDLRIEPVELIDAGEHASDKE
jgi:hypothetical protein